MLKRTKEKRKMICSLLTEYLKTVLILLNKDLS